MGEGEKEEMIQICVFGIDILVDICLISFLWE